MGTGKRERMGHGMKKNMGTAYIAGSDESNLFSPSYCDCNPLCHFGMERTNGGKRIKREEGDGRMIGD